MKTFYERDPPTEQAGISRNFPRPRLKTVPRVLPVLTIATRGWRVAEIISCRLYTLYRRIICIPYVVLCRVHTQAYVSSSRRTKNGSPRRTPAALVSEPKNDMFDGTVDWKKKKLTRHYRQTQSCTAGGTRGGWRSFRVPLGETYEFKQFS